MSKFAKWLLVNAAILAFVFSGTMLDVTWMMYVVSFIIGLTFIGGTFLMDHTHYTKKYNNVGYREYMFYSTLDNIVDMCIVGMLLATSNFVLAILFLVPFIRNLGLREKGFNEAKSIRMYTKG